MAMSSDWFAAFSPDMLKSGATRATGATVAPEPQNSGQLALKSRSGVGCNKGATGCNAPGVAPVAPVRKSGATQPVAPKAPEMLASSEFVAPVAPVAPKTEEQMASDLRDRYEERAAFLEYQEGSDRPNAEHQAYAEVYECAE